MAVEIQHPSRWIGIVDKASNAFGWPGSGFSLAFNGTSLSVTLKDSGQNSVIVSHDGQSFRLNLTSGTHAYQLAANMSAGAHVVNVTRRTEGFLGNTEFVSATTDGAFLLAQEPDRRLLIIGDSISAGYGIEGANSRCQFSAETENQYLTYGALAARRNHAEVTTLAISGIGVSRNNSGQPGPNMPELMDRPTPSVARTNPNQLRAPPDYKAIVINLGTNDFTGGSRPAGFGAAYTALLKKLRQMQPNAMIYAALGPMLGEADFNAAARAIGQAVTDRQAEGDKRLAYLRLKNKNTGGTGCNWHPNGAAHVALAAILNQALQRDLGWTVP